MNSSIKTTIGGIITAVGIGLTQMADGNMQLIGGVAAALGALLTGWMARDNNVTSKEAGAE